MKIYDVSLKLHAGMPVYPRNAPFAMRKVAKATAATTNLSEISMGVHSGTHVDSQRHVKTGAAGKWQLEKLFGRCIVVDCDPVQFGRGIERAHLAGKKIKRGEIVLLKTGNSKRGFGKFYSDFVYLAQSGAQCLKEKGAKAVGIDSIAIQKFHSGNQLVHRALLLSGIPVIEGLDLKGVPAGEYEFFCLPLKMESDGLPARAILVKR